MANRTVNLGPKAERGLGLQLTAWNAELAKQVPPPTPWTADQLYQELSKPLIESLITTGIDVGSRDIRKALDAALESGNATVIANVKTALGIA